MKIIDRNPPRFGRVRWWLVRKLLAALNLVEGRFAKVREWALEEAVASSPDFDTFQAWVVEHVDELKLGLLRAAAAAPGMEPVELVFHEIDAAVERHHHAQLHRRAWLQLDQPE